MSTLTVDAARLLTDEVKADAAALWAKLLQLYEGEAHFTLGYSSWGAYYAEEFDQSPRSGYRLLDAARVCEAVEQFSDQMVTESVARELVPVLRDDPEQVPEVWGEVVAEHGPTPTAKQVREAERRDRRPDRHVRREHAPHRRPGRPHGRARRTRSRRPSRQAIGMRLAHVELACAIRARFAHGRTGGCTSGTPAEEFGQTGTRGKP